MPPSVAPLPVVPLVPVLSSPPPPTGVPVSPPAPPSATVSPTHEPFSQRPELPQAAPFGLRGSEQVPVEASQLPAWWQESSAAHSTSVPTQAPSAQASSSVHGLPSLQASLTGACVQPSAASQSSAVQVTVSSQSSAVPP